MNIAAIAQRIGADPRVLRYVLFHGLVPGADDASLGRGTTRSFSVSEAFAIALAARLFAGGLRQPFVKGLLRGLMDKAGALEPTLAKPPDPDESTLFEVADGVNVRMRRGRGGALDDPAWTALAGGRVLERSYRPGVVTSVDLADLIRRLHGL